jgi:hypothetical protein
MSTLAGFRDALQKLINEHSMENGSDTPDFILAEYLTDCLAAFDKIIRERRRWYGGSKEPVTPATVEELNAILNPPEGPPVEVMPDGSVRPDLRREEVKGRGGR